jgi:hypothetical protein
MGNFRASSEFSVFTNVFQHFVNDSAVNRLKVAILEVIYRSTNQIEGSYPRISDTKKTIDPNRYQQLREVIYPNLYYGSFNLTKTRTLGHEIIWKWTEATGKIVGCQFWSIEAKNFFDAELRKRCGDRPSFNEAWSLGKELSSRKYGRNSLNHEHVLPIMKLREILLTPSAFRHLTGSLAHLGKFFERAVVGCVLLKGEHEEIHSSLEDSENPWIRYQDSSIKLVPNPKWTDAQRKLIANVNLV